MYRILIADDEANTLNKLKTTFESTGLYSIDTASDGQEAYELASGTSYDALVLDIMMPRLTGMELLERINDITPAPIKIIITGYDRFEFAKEAIKYGVSEFLLKPMDSDDICRLSMRIAEIIETRRSVRSKERELRERADKMKGVLKQRFLETLAVAPLKQEYIEESKDKYGIVFAEPFFRCAFISLEDKDAHLEDVQQLMLLDSLTEHSKRSCGIFAFGLCDGSIGVIFNERHKNSAADIDMALSAVIEIAKLSWNLDIMCGIGNAVDSVMSIPMSYKQAKDAFLCNRAMDFSTVMHYTDLNESFDELSDQLHYNEICNALKTERTKEITDRIKYICKKNYTSGVNRKAMQLIVNKVVFACQTMCRTYEIEMNKEKILPLLPVVFGDEDGSGLQIDAALCDLIADVSARIKKHNDSKYNYIVTRAKKYIDKNYMRDISVIEIADEMGVSNNYLGKLFKNAMGISISNYINNVRVQKAVELLEGTNKKLYEIGEEVGYNNQHYFSTIFKQIVGVSPSEYRDIM